MQYVPFCCSCDKWHLETCSPSDRGLIDHNGNMEFGNALLLSGSAICVFVPLAMVEPCVL